MSRLSPTATLGLMLVVVGSGCGAGDEDPSGSMSLAQAIEGPWQIPAATLAIGDDQDVPYTGAGPWPGTCAPGLKSGARALGDFLRLHFPQITLVGGYNCRAIVGDSSHMSVHGTGRAVDLSIALDGGGADNDAGDPIGNWLIEHAEEIGIQMVIWDRWSWRSNRPVGDRSRYYAGEHPHHDHLHVELSVDGGDERTPWFSGEKPFVVSGCEPLPPAGGVIEETGACFNAFGASQYWRAVDGEGHDDSLLWTNAFENSEPSNWARWYVRVSEPGAYLIEYYAVPDYALHRETRYAIGHEGETTSLVVDQAAAVEGWNQLAQITFGGELPEHVSVYDNSPGPVAEDQHIVVDALRLTRLPLETLVVQRRRIGEPQQASGPGGSSRADGGCNIAGDHGGTPAGAPLPLVLMALLVGRARRRGRRR